MADKNINPATSSEAVIAIVDEDFLHGRIHEIRGQKVMLDFELAEIYGYSTTAFNQQVKNNIEKFDEDFRFQLTRDEWANLISKNLTSSWGGRRKPPHAFTEQGVYMLMTVLRGDLATRQSKALIRLFKNMKDRVEDGAALVSQREFLSLSMAVSGSIAEVAELRRELNAVEDDVAAIIDEIDGIARESEIKAVIENFGKAVERKGFLILEGELVEASAAYAKIYSEADSSVFVVDNYVGARTLERLLDVRDGVKVTLFTDNKGGRLRAADVMAFQSEHSGVHLELRTAGGFVHDRYIALDYGTDCERVFLCGASSKDAGKRASTIIEVENPELFRPLFDVLLANPPLNLG